MIEPNSSWICQRNSAWQPQSFNYLTANATTWHAEPMPAHVDPHYVSPNGYNNCGLPAEKGVKIEDEARFEQHQLHFPSVHDSQPKKFLIFDRSGEKTRMILSTLCSPVYNGKAITTEPVSTYKSLENLHAFKSEQSCPKLPDLSENSGENHVTDEGSDYHEDTEELNALLYSCDDDIDDDIHDHEDGDEISTGRSPNFINGHYKNTEGDEVSSFWRSSKRQKLFEGDSYSKLSCVETNKDGKKTRMHKIHDTLRTLQKFIPDSKTKEPLVIIDEAISYLNFIKGQVSAHGQI